MKRLEFLEGLRGLTAFYVLVFHAVHGFQPKPDKLPLQALFRLTAFGHEAVAIFIVLSGFCLTLSATRGGTSNVLEIAPKLFFKRRAVRILPPYYFALGLSWAAIALIPILRSANTGTIWDNSHPAFSMPSVLSHLFLVHNWNPILKFTINGPLWSVATEWQIYFLFAAVLAPIRTRFGPLALLAVAIGLGYGPWLFFPRASAAAVTWYVPLFALGMCACLGTWGIGTPEHSWLAKLPLSKAAFYSTAIVLLLGLGLARIWFRFQPLTDLLVGIATALAVASLAAQSNPHQLGPSNQLAQSSHLAQSNHAKRSVALRVLEHPYLSGLGRMSYSLYLTHLPIVALVTLGFRENSAALSPIVPIIASITLSLCFAFAFYAVVERPVLSKPRA